MNISDCYKQDLALLVFKYLQDSLEIEYNKIVSGRETYGALVSLSFDLSPFAHDSETFRKVKEYFMYDKIMYIRYSEDSIFNRLQRSIIVGVLLFCEKNNLELEFCSEYKSRHDGMTLHFSPVGLTDD